MQYKQIAHNLADMTDKFKLYFEQRAKCKALDNFDGATGYRQSKWIILVKECMKEGFLDEKESIFIDHLLDKAEINYLDWNVRTPWVKKQICKLSAKATNPDPRPADLFTWKAAKELYIPPHLLNTQTATQMARHA